MFYQFYTFKLGGMKNDEINCRNFNKNTVHLAHAGVGRRMQQRLLGQQR